LSVKGSVYKRAPVVSRVADFVLVIEELVESVLLQAEIDFQRVVWGRSTNFGPAFGDVGPFMLHLQLLPTLVEWFRDDRLEGAEKNHSPE